MLDYEVIPVPGNPSIDLLGAHYLHQLNPWLYLGIGLYTPLFDGNYGGFMAFDTTIHAQHSIFGNSFIDAGGSFGGGGGGSSISQSRELSGKGGFIKAYLGLGYHFSGFSAGINYADFRFIHSRINHSQLAFFIQTLISSQIGSYAHSGQRMESDDAFPEGGENILSLELNNIFQLKPKGSYTSTINLSSLQFSHFLSKNRYLFFGLGIGYKGLPLYNQAFGGIGYRISISPRAKLYGQIGVGSGGYSPAEIDTGSGLLVYPKVSLEYLLNNHLGLALSGGYLFAPKGSSRNFTLGAAVNYHLSTEEQNLRSFGTAREFVLRGFRFSLFQQTEFNVRVGNRKHGNINLLSGQFDYIVNDHWYIPLQASVAYNDFFGYPGYGEILTGLGIQSKFSTSNRFQSFFQLLVGANVLGVVLKPSIGVDYGLSDHLALYGQFGKVITLKKTSPYPGDQRFSSYAIGFGLTYRFSLPDALLE